MLRIMKLMEVPGQTSVTQTVMSKVTISKTITWTWIMVPNINILPLVFIIYGRAVLFSTKELIKLMTQWLSPFQTCNLNWFSKLSNSSFHWYLELIHLHVTIPDWINLFDLTSHLVFFVCHKSTQDTNYMVWPRCPDPRQASAGRERYKGTSIGTRFKGFQSILT